MFKRKFRKEKEVTGSRTVTIQYYIDCKKRFILLRNYNGGWTLCGPDGSLISGHDSIRSGEDEIRKILFVEKGKKAITVKKYKDGRVTNFFEVYVDGIERARGVRVCGKWSVTFDGKTINVTSMAAGIRMVKRAVGGEASV